MSTGKWYVIPRQGVSDALSEKELATGLRVVLSALARQAYAEGLRFADRAPGQRARDLTPEETIAILVSCAIRTEWERLEFACPRCNELAPLSADAKTGEPVLLPHGECSGFVFVDSVERAKALAMLVAMRLVREAAA